MSEMSAQRAVDNREFAIAAVKTAMMTLVAFFGFIIAPQFFPLTMLTVVTLFVTPVIWRAYFGQRRRRRKTKPAAAADAAAPDSAALPLFAIPAAR